MRGLEIFIGLSNIGDGFQISTTHMNGFPQVNFTVLVPKVVDDKYISVPGSTTFLDKETALRLAGAIQLAAQQLGKGISDD
jgi:hypothetical protein